MYKSATYASWVHMKTRCYDPRHESHPMYGGRGISVCDRWRESFEAFLADMGERPNGRTLDRIDTNGNYEPGNCRRATPPEQNRNMRSNLRFEVNGVSKIAKDWAAQYGIPYNTLLWRIRHGADPVLAVTTPSQGRGRRRAS